MKNASKTVSVKLQPYLDCDTCVYTVLDLSHHKQLMMEYYV